VIAGVALFVLALIVLGMSLIMGRSDELDYQPKVDLLNRTALTRIQQDAKQGNPQAQYDLGRTYWQNAEYQQAFPLLKAAADHHHIEAEYQLGMASASPWNSSPRLPGKRILKPNINSASFIGMGWAHRPIRSRPISGSTSLPRADTKMH
jgi:hypothetical protein